MGRLLLVALVGIAMVAAMMLAPLTHLHVATEEHHHADSESHRHGSKVHAHLTAHEDWSEPSNGVLPTQLGPPGHDDVVSLDTMLTEPAAKVSVLAGVSIDILLPVLSAAGHGHMLSEPRAHGPPIGLSVLGRAPPA